jgi:hypothetical protein
MVATYTTPTATDLVDGTDAVTCLPASGSTFPLGTTTVNCNSVDVAGNHAIQTTFNVTVQDTTAPALDVTGFTANSISMPGDISGGYSLSIDGNANTHYQLQFAAGSVASENLQTEDVGLFLQPTAGQTADLIAYYSTKPAEYLAYLDAAAAGTQPFAYIKTGGTAIQILDGAQKFLASIETDMLVPGNYPLGTYTVTGTIHDLAGNPTVVTYILKVVDTTAPDITAPADQTFGATGPTTTPTLVPATATDNIDLNPVVTYDIHSFPVGDTTVTWTATDASGNTATTTSKVTITDTTAPDITAPADQTFEATGPTTTPTLVPATATDIADPSPVITYTPHDFSVGADQTVTWTATDASGNTATTTSKVTITDTTAPVITVLGAGNNGNPAYVVVGTIYTDAGATATDIVDGSVSVVPSGSVDTNTIGSYIITYTATDSASNTATQTRTVDVISANQTITVSQSDGGSISAIAPTFTNPTYEIAANSGYYISDVLMDGSSVVSQPGFAWITGNTVADYTFTNVIAPHTLSAVFTLIP